MCAGTTIRPDWRIGRVVFIVTFYHSLARGTKIYMRILHISGYAKEGNMKQRGFGFLQPNERAYLASQDHYHPRLGEEVNKKEVHEDQAKHRIQTEVATISAFQEGIEQFRKDLTALQAFQDDDEGRWREWESDVLPVAKHELELLRDILDLMISFAEREDIKDEQAELERALRPLRSDLELANLYDRYPPGERDVDALSELLSKMEWDDDRNPVAPEELVSQLGEKDKREDALVALLRKDGLAEILEHIHKNGRCELPPKKNWGGTGQWWTGLASQFLANEYGLVNRYEISSTRKEFEITDRGEVVLRTWHLLKETDAVVAERAVKPDASDRALIRDLLDRHSILMPESDAMAHSADS